MWRRVVLGVAISLFGASGAEAQSSRAAFVEHLYENYFGRDPFYSELDYWLDRMDRRGDSRIVVEAGIIGSPAYFQQNRYNTTRWIRDAFRRVLGRKPDGSELNSWVRRLARLDGDREEWALEFLSEMKYGRGNYAGRYEYGRNKRRYRDDYGERDHYGYRDNYAHRDRYVYRDRYAYRDRNGYRDPDQYEEDDDYRYQQRRSRYR